MRKFDNQSFVSLDEKSILRIQTNNLSIYTPRELSMACSLSLDDDVSNFPFPKVRKDENKNHRPQLKEKESKNQ